MPDNTQALGYASQSAFGTPALPTAPMYGVVQFTNPPKQTSGSDHFKMNQPFNQTEVHVDVREGQVDWTLAITPTNILPVCESALGPAASGVSKAGVGVPKFLTVRFVEGLVQYWLAQDHLVNTVRFTYNLTEGFRAVVQSLGPAPAATASAWTTVAPLPTGKLPFRAWQCFLNLGGVAYCVRRMEIGVDNKLTPLLCSPGALPGSTTLAGLTPTRYKRGDGEVSVQIEALYTGNVGSEFEKFQQQLVSGPWQITAIDPSGTAAFTLDIPRLGYTEAEIMREDVPFERLTGFALFSTTDGTPLVATVVS